jgi:Transcriptional Coactivator p15 (PC4)
MIMQPFEIQKNSKEILRIERSPYKGIDLVSMRIFVENEDGIWRPTTKGISLRPDLWRQILPVLSSELLPAFPDDMQ